MKCDASYTIFSSFALLIYRTFIQTYSATSLFNPHWDMDKTFSPSYSSSQLTYVQWWILGEANEAVASGPPFFGGRSSILRPPLENSIYSFGFAQRTIRSEDLFFFFFLFGEYLDFGRKRGKSEMKLK